MKISTKLMIIVALTVAEVSLTLWSVFEISKGATLHQLNVNHLKYNAVFSEQVERLNMGQNIDAPMLKGTIEQIKQQPIDCIEQINALNRFIMRRIGTIYALEICNKDIEDANNALVLVDSFEKRQIDNEMLVVQLKAFVHIFNDNSAAFQKPTSDTVSFVLRMMIPMVVFISLFNIIFIGYMSRSISGSIRGLITLVSKQSNELDKVIEQNVTGELRELLDVTKERLTHEIMMTEVNKVLEDVVKTRTESLEKANSELEQFAYRTSHDLKAPLTSTKGLAQFIAQDIKDGNLEDAINDAQRIEKQMNKLEELVTGILSLTKASSSNGDLAPIDLEGMIEHAREFNQRTLSERNIQFFTQVHFDSPMLSEETRIKQILDNLISNAIKYADDSKSEKMVKVCAYENETAHIIEIEDNGLGIPESRQNEMFEMFKRFHPNVSVGSGLGLSIVKKHLDSLDAIISVISSDNGTRFTLTFPKRENI